MNILDFSSYNLSFIGDIHGEFQKLIQTIRGKHLKDTVLIAVGDVGMGFNKTQYYIDLFKGFNETILKPQNVIVVFMRGNHDDPKFFIEKFFDFSNIFLIPDYTVIKTNKHNTLCVGGGLSIDRSWRISEENRINRFKQNKDDWKHFYWNDEAFIFDDTKIDKNAEIDSVATHINPRLDKYIQIKNKQLDYWCETDLSLRDEYEMESKEITKLYDFVTNNFKINFWVNGHLHYKDTFNHNGITHYQLGEDLSIQKMNEEKKELKDVLDFSDFVLKSSKVKYEPIGAYDDTDEEIMEMLNEPYTIQNIGINHAHGAPF